MARRVANASGLASSASIWDTVTNTPGIQASANLDVTAGNVFTAAFTAPNTTNACTGVLLFVVAAGTSGIITVTLQQSTVDTAASASIDVANLPVVASNLGNQGSWVYFRFPVPYVFATTTASAYRFRITGASLVGTTSLAASNAGGTLASYLATDNRNTALSTTADDVFVVGHNLTTPIEVTVDGTQQWGSRTDVSAGISSRSFGLALNIYKGGMLKWDTSASSQLTLRGTGVIGPQGELQMGTVASPLPYGQTAKLIFSTASDGQGGIKNTGKLTLQGAPQTSTTLWKTKYASGVGTAADPLITSTAVDWAVGDEIEIASTDLYTQTEKRFIITKNSATSYVVSTTAGGAETALTYTHTTDADIINLQRNVIWTTDDTTKYWYFANYSTIAGDMDVDWARFEYVGENSNASKYGFTIQGAFTVEADIDYCVVYSVGFRGLIWQMSVMPSSHTGLVVTSSGPTQNIGLFVSGSAHSKSFIDCFVLNQTNFGIYVQNVANCSMTRVRAISNAQSGSSGHGGLVLDAAVNFAANDCDVHANGSNGLLIQNVAASSMASSRVGTRGANVIADVAVADDTFNDFLFDACSFGSPTLITNYADQSRGSSINFYKHNNTANKHFWYTDAGKGEATGAGLTDTTVRTSGSLATKISPEDATNGFVWETLIPAIPDSSTFISGYLRRSVAGGTAKIELFLPGSTVADASYTFDTTTDTWLPFMVSAYYSGDETLYATVRVTVIGNSGAFYLDDFYDAGVNNKVAGFDLWYRGKPAPVFSAIDVSGVPALVWAYPTSNLEVADTTGKTLVDTGDDLTTGKFLALK